LTPWRSLCSDTASERRGNCRKGDDEGVPRHDEEIEFEKADHLSGGRTGGTVGRTGANDGREYRGYRHGDHDDNDRGDDRGQKQENGIADKLPDPAGGDALCGFEEEANDEEWTERHVRMVTRS